MTDSEMRRIAHNAALEANRMARELGPDNLRAVKAQLAASSTAMWAGVGDAIKVGVGDAVYSATEWQAHFDERMFAHAKIPSQYWRQSMIATSQEGAQNIISRRTNNMTLSDRVWRNSERAKAGLNQAIDNGLALGKSAAEIANDVSKYLRPDVPGGASSAAMRLGRTEVLNAYHTTSVRKYQETPWVEFVQWNLSGSHPRPDECNEYAEDVPIPRGDPGVYRPMDVPSKPHPNCLCYVTPVVMDLDKYVKNFQSGKYDEYIDRQMGCSRVA